MAKYFRLSVREWLVKVNDDEELPLVISEYLEANSIADRVEAREITLPEKYQDNWLDADTTKDG